MSLCDLNCCDLKWLQTKFDAINKKISDNKKIQDKINANIFKLLKENGIDVETLLKNYYALNEDDYTKTLTSEDDINTLEPGTYKIVKEDMPQNAPDGIGIATYNGTLIKSQNYMALFEDTGFHFAPGIVSNDNVIWTWYHYISKTHIDLLLSNYMKIRNYDKFNYSDLHDLTGFAEGVYYVDASVKNLPIAKEGILIIRQGVNKTDNYIVMYLQQNSNDIYKCYKKTNNTWSVWERLAFYSNIPSLDGYATQAWVNQQIQDITGGSVTADWVKSNYYPLTTSQYNIVAEKTELASLPIGVSVINSNNLTDKLDLIPANANLVITKSNSIANSYVYMIYDHSNVTYYVINNNNIITRKFAFTSDIPSLSGYATQAWVQSQNYLTEIPSDYATDGEVSQAIATALVGYATQAWVNEQISKITGGAVTTDIVTQMISNAITGYATQEWVNSRGFLTEIPDEYITLTELQSQNYVTQSWVTDRAYQTSTQVETAITEALNGYATQTWTKSNFYSLSKELYSNITSNENLNDYTEPGTYLCINSLITATLSNKPTSLQYSFKLIVEDIGGGSYFIQKIIEMGTSNCYIRACSGGSFKNWEEVVFKSDINGYATQEWVGQQGYQTVRQVNSLIKNATNDMLTQEDLDTLNYVTENWVLHTALDGYATENWINTKLNNYLPKKETIALTTQGTYYGLQYQWVRYGQVVEVFLVGNLTQEISNQLISNFCPANPMGTLQITIAGYDSKTNYAEFNGNGLKLMGTYSNELYVNCHFTYLTNE